MRQIHSQSNLFRTYFVSFFCLFAMMFVFIGACGDESCKSNADCKGGKVCVSGICGAQEPGSSEKKEELSSADAGLPKCPEKCKADRDCVFCGNRKTCDPDSNTCVDLRVQCPKICNNDKDCTREGCAARTTCNTLIHECVERLPACPDTCKADDDCTLAGCGPRSQCSTKFGTCVDPTVANCPFTCKDNTGCVKCGERNQCSFSSPTGTNGVCRAFAQHACPDFCNTLSNCFTKGCGERLYCNYATKKCVNKDHICPFICKTSNDCSKECGDRTFCYVSAPGRSGYCAKPPTGKTCPKNCRTSFVCKSKDCGDKAFCNLASRTCVTKEEACPGSCQKNEDCPKEKCGASVLCRRGRCVNR